MKYGYAVKFGGVYYPAGSDVPEEENVKSSEEKVEENTSEKEVAAEPKRRGRKKE